MLSSLDAVLPAVVMLGRRGDAHRGSWAVVAKRRRAFDRRAQLGRLSALAIVTALPASSASGSLRAAVGGANAADAFRSARRVAGRPGAER
jgi:hypothetical protein